MSTTKKGDQMKLEQIHIYVPKEEAEKIKAKAQEYGLPISQYAKLKLLDKIK